MTLHGVIFDLGGTLVEYGGPRDWEWPGLEAFRKALEGFGYRAPATETLLAVHERRIANLYQRLEEDPDATQTQDQIFGAMLAEAGISLSQVQWDEARARYYYACREHIRAVPHAQEMLKAVSARGLRLAAASNTHWPGVEIDRFLDDLGIGAYVPARFYSADEAAWKPWPGLLQRALAALDLPPDAVVYVGDLPQYDVRAARRAGMRAVWLNRRDAAMMDGLTPDATIRALPELLDVVDRWVGVP